MKHVPTMPPMPIVEPIRAISDADSGPLAKGDTSDSSTKNADDVQPTAVPYAIVLKFATKLNQIAQNYLKKQNLVEQMSLCVPQIITRY